MLDPSLKNAHILIVDDQEPNNLLLEGTLKRDGYANLKSTTDSRRVLALYDEFQPDLILLDLHMPHPDGYEVLEQLRAIIAPDDYLPILVLTADVATDTKLRALAGGASDFLVKPIDVAETSLRVRNLLETRYLYQQQRIQNQILDAKVIERTSELDGARRSLEQILATMPAGVLLLDADRRIVVTNLAGAEDLAVLTDAHVGDILTTLGGRPLAELLTSPPIKGLWHEIAAGEHIFEVIARPVVQGSSPESYVLVLSDVTREREVRAELQRQERLATVGQLAAGIAHDFNNILAVVLLYAQMDLRAPDLPSRFRPHLQTIAQEATHATSLIQQILDFGRRTVLEPHPLDLVPLLKERVKLLERTLPESIRIELDCRSIEAVVKADPTRIQQMVTNLAVNARDAMADGGDLRFELQRVQCEPHQSTPLPNMAPGPWIRIAVSDTGIGIPAELRNHLFEPFFTTKAPGKGSGLGLAQVYGIVKQHEGHIGVQSQVGQGTTFTIYLPAFGATSVEGPRADLAPVALGHGETVLVVEDNAALRAAMDATLALLNYRTLQAANGHEALALLEQRGGEIAVVLSDLVMPEMGGQALFYALKERGLQVPMVMMTGHPMDRELLALKDKGLAGWVLKPPSIEDLAMALAQAVHSESKSGMTGGTR